MNFVSNSTFFITILPLNQPFDRLLRYLQISNFKLGVGMTTCTATITDKRTPSMQANLKLVSRGWDALVEKLGYADATRFVMLIDKGSGDAVKYFRELWKDASAEEIYRQVVAQHRRTMTE